MYLPIATRNSRPAIAEYIVYHSDHRRIKESLGWLSPAQYRRKHLAA
ncbi:IS3 family transposase [Selenomonas felix]